MADYDGSIRINTQIDTKNASSQMLRLENQISKAAKKAADLTEKMRQMENQKAPTEEFKAVQEQIDDAQKKLDSLNAKMEKFVQTGGKTDSRTFKGMKYDADQLIKTIEYAKGEMADMQSSGGAYMNVGDVQETDAYKKMASDLSDANAKVSELSRKQEELASKESKVGAQADKSKGKTSGWLDSFKSKAKATGEKVSGLASRLKSAGASFKNFISHGKSGSGMLGTFASRLRGIALSMFVFNWITKAWNAMLSAIKDGTGNIAKYSGDVNAKMSQLTSAVATLKNAFGALAAPIISAVAPALTSLINMLTGALNKINQFISALTGGKTWIKATKQVKNYAGGLKSASSGAEKAAKSAKKLKGQLQSFNELNVISSNDSGGSGGGSGGGGGGGVGDMFTTENIDPKIASLAKKIKEILKTDDWSEIGEMLGKKLNDALAGIPWNGIKSRHAI